MGYESWACGFEINSCGWSFASYLTPCIALGGSMTRTNACAHTGSWCGRGTAATGGVARDFDFSRARADETVDIELWYSGCGLLGGTNFGYLKVRDCDTGEWLYNVAIGTTASGDAAWHYFHQDISDVAGRPNIRIFLLAEVGSVRQHIDDILIAWYERDDFASLGNVGLFSPACGSINLENVLNWKEEEGVPIPIKKILRRADVTTQAEYYSLTPRVINLELRGTRSLLNTLEDCKHCAGFAELYDYDGTFVDNVFIENISPTWAGDEDKDYPWLVRLMLVCSSV